jgi:SAM-dependent methyltransferase
MIQAIANLDSLVREYDQWFQKHRFVYESELEALKRFVPSKGLGLEISVNTGRFAGSLGIKKGVEYYPKMRSLAESRGIEVFESTQETLPFEHDEFDYCLLVDVAFLDDLRISFEQVHRILKPGGKFILGFIDKNSPIGKIYQSRKDTSPFYGQAQHYSVSEINELLANAGFKNLEYLQTIFGNELNEIKNRQLPKEGYGKASFIIIKSTRL